MKKLFTLLTLALISIGSAWGTDYNLTQDVYSDGIFTVDEIAFTIAKGSTSGHAGNVSGSDKLFKLSKNATYTIELPTGFTATNIKIIGYTNASSNNASITEVCGSTISSDNIFALNTVASTESDWTTFSKALSSVTGSITFKVANANQICAYIVITGSQAAVDPVFSLTKSTIGTDETSRIQVGTKGTLDGITLTGLASSDETVATVDGTGLISPLKAGTTTISFTASSGVSGKWNATSEKVSLSLTVTDPIVENPMFNPAEDSEFNGTLEVTITCATDGATIKYSYDNSTWNDYTDALSLTETKTIYAKAVKTGLNDSEVISKTYTFVPSGDPTTISASTTTFIDFSELTGSSEGVALGVSRTEGNYKIINHADYPWKVYTTNVTVDGRTLTRYMNSGGSSNASRRLIQISVTGPAIIKVYGKSASGTRAINIYKASFDNGNIVKTGDVTTSDWGIVEYLYTESETATFLIGTGNNLHIGGIVVQPASVSVPVGTTGWSTYSSAYALDFENAQEGIEAYVITGFEGTTLTTSKITGTVAANTGLLVKGTASTNYNVPVVATGDAPTANLLVASVAGETVEKGTGDNVNYVLVNNGGTAEFQWIDETSATLGSNKAYLQIVNGPKSETSAHGLTIDLDGELTGIKNIKVGSEDNIYYDLQGHRVLYPTKGLYIVNGKKVILK